MPEFVISNVGRRVVTGRGGTKRDDTAGQGVRYFRDTRDVAVYDECSIRRQQFGEFMERIANVIDIFEKIQMIFFYIKNDTDFWKKA